MNAAIFTITAVSLFLIAGCSQDPRGDGLAVSGGTGGVPGAFDTGSDTGGSEEGDSSTGATVLDAAPGQTPAGECVAVSQVAEVEERPGDLIMIADPEADQVLFHNAVVNLLPQLQSEGITDVHVVLIAGPPPPAGSDPKSTPEFDCGEWLCRGATAYPFFHSIEADIGPDTVLTDLLALSDEWVPHMRTDTWKHLWISSSQGSDTQLAGEEFGAAFTAFGPSYERFTFNALVTPTSPAGAVEAAFGELAETTGGAYFVAGGQGGGDVYSQYVESVSERLKGSPLSCEYQIPDPPQGQTLAPDKVNVEYFDGTGQQAIGYLEEVSDCDINGAGWYYDDPNDPAVIHMCPYTCGVFNTLETGSIDIVFGCDTIPAG